MLGLGKSNCNAAYIAMFADMDDFMVCDGVMIRKAVLHTHRHNRSLLMVLK
jgi:hypothetical protein